MLVFWIIFDFAELVHLYLNETANKHNSWIWGTKIPNLPEDAPLRPSNYTVWCALATASIVGFVQLQQNVTSESHRTPAEKNIIHSDKKRVAISMQCFYIKTQHEQAMITASPPLPWLTFLHAMALDFEHGGFGHHYYLLTLNPSLFLCTSLKGNVGGTVLTVLRMTQLKCAVPENTNADIFRSEKCKMSLCLWGGRWKN